MLTHAVRARARFAALVAVAVTALGSLTAVPPATAQTTRDPFLWPFSVDSPWNTPIGSGVRFAGETDPRTRDVRYGGAGINAGGWSHPVYQATSGDPVRRMSDRDGGRTTSASFQVPNDAKPAAAPNNPYNGPGDAHLYVVTPDGRNVHEMWSVIRQPDMNLSVRHYAQVSLYGTGVASDGVRAYGGSGLGGLMRRWELEAGQIRHALAVAMNHDQMRKGPVWPATREDGGNSGYVGSVPMGTLMAIPGDVRLETLGLSRGGLMLARALQDYGAYLVDGSTRFTMYAEPTAEGMPVLTEMRRDAGRLQDLLRPVTNNTPTSVGGGGTPRQPLAPPLRGQGGGHGDAPLGTTAPAPVAAVGAAVGPGGGGVWVGYGNGAVQSVGKAAAHGGAGGMRLNAPIVGMAPTADGGGYWLLGQDGGVFSYGNARFHGSTGGMRLNRPVVSLAAHPRGGGYWFVASDGGVFSFGAPFHGSAGGMRLNQPVVGMAPTRSGEGYWLVARDGGVFAYGDAEFSGSTGSLRLNQPIVAMAADPDGRGYWFVAADGGVFAFDAPFHGSAVGRLAAGDRVVNLLAHPGGGYWVVTARGAVLPFGGAGGVARAAA